MDASGGSLVAEVHANGADIDSLLSNDPDEDKTRRLLEPYERHRAHDLRAECYRRGIRPIKKGPNANDNKNGYILLLRKDDSGQNGSNASALQTIRDERSDDEDSTATAEDVQAINSLADKRKQVQQIQEPPTSSSLQGFYEAAQPSVNAMPMQYPPAMQKSSANPTTDLEILSGIANSYTQNVAAEGQLCGNCRTVVTDQLMESIRLGKTKMRLQEYHKLTDQRDRDTAHLKEVLGVLRDLRKSYREAQADGMNHELLIELQDDLAFFRALKEQTKQRMRQAMLEARERANKSNASA